MLRRRNHRTDEGQQGDVPACSGGGGERSEWDLGGALCGVRYVRPQTPIL